MTIMLQELSETSYADAELFETTLSNMDQITSLFTAFETFNKMHRSDSAFSVYNGQYLSLFAEMAGNISTVEEIEDANAARMYRTANIIKYVCIVLELLLGVISIFFGLSLSKLLAKMLNESIYELKDSAAESAKNQEEAAHNVSMVAKEAAKGKDEISRLLEAMERITGTSKEIEDITASIEEIASQTNLLSLNASIEAANTRDLIAKSLAEIDSGNTITKNTAAVLEEVLNSMNEVQEIVKNSSIASQSQAAMLKDIAQTIEEISSVVESNSASAEQNSATSQELTSQSDSMNNMIAEFRLRES